MIMHYLYVGVILFLLMVYLPYSTNTSFRGNSFLLIFFFIQLAYFIVSAKQISHGYPNADNNIANMIERDYSIVNRVLFFAYRYMPFLFELHQILDWTISNTSLNIIHWFKVYSAHAILYDAKCRVVCNSFI